MMHKMSYYLLLQLSQANITTGIIENFVALNVNQIVIFYMPIFSVIMTFVFD